MPTPEQVAAALAEPPIIVGDQVLISLNTWAVLWQVTHDQATQKPRHKPRRAKTVDGEHAYMREGAGPTEREAYVYARRHSPTARDRVHRALTLYPEGLTDEEMQTLLGMNPSTQRPRRLELVEGGWVVDSGRVRETRVGLKAIVWRIACDTEKGPAT